MKTIEQAIESEKKNGGIKKLFSFWVRPKKDKTCNFTNGKWCYQRKDHEYLKLVDALIKGVNEYEPWIASQYEKHGGLKREYIGGGYMIGRYLDDGHSELNEWYHIISNICPKCFREWGQPYYANNCNHNTRSRGLDGQK